MPSIISFNKLWDSQDDLSLNNVSGTVIFRAVFDSTTSDFGAISPSDALEHPDCPRRWSSVHPRFPFAICSSLKPVRKPELPNVIDVTVTYETFQSSVDNKGKPLDQEPAKRPLQVEWQTWNHRKPILTWIPYGPTSREPSGEPITPFAPSGSGEPQPFCNSAGDRILIEEEHSHRQLVCSKYVKKMDPIFATGGDWVNSDSVTIDGFKFGKHELWASNINFGKTEVVNGFLAKLMTFTLRHNPDTWILRADNLGYNHIAYREVISANSKTDLALNLIPIKIHNPPENTSQPIPLLSENSRVQRIRPITLPQPPAQAANFPASKYNMCPEWGPSSLTLKESGGVTNGDFSHGHAHPAFLDFNDKGEPIEGKNLTPEIIAKIYAENRLYGLTRPLLSFNQYFPLS